VAYLWIPHDSDSLQFAPRSPSHVRPTGIWNGQFCEAKPSETADILNDTLAKDCRNEMTGGLNPADPKSRHEHVLLRSKADDVSELDKTQWRHFFTSMGKSEISRMLSLLKTHMTVSRPLTLRAPTILASINTSFSICLLVRITTLGVALNFASTT
jgi:hypothetical protein